MSDFKKLLEERREILAEAKVAFAREPSPEVEKECNQLIDQVAAIDARLVAVAEAALAD